MKKDPYFPMYFRDFLASTDLMNNEQVGAHIRILCHQADKGHLPESSIRERICGPIWESLMGRYKQDEQGLWYHERMEKTLKERKRYIESRTSNLKAPHMDTPYEEPICDPLVVRSSSSSLIKDLTVAIAPEPTTKSKPKKSKLPADPRHHEIVTRFFKFYKERYPNEYTINTREFKTLSDFLENNTELTADRFGIAVIGCFNDEKFHKKNLSIHYVCNNFPLLERLGLRND